VAALRAEPRYFGPPARPCFGWLHGAAPGTPARDVGLVVCNPFGYEALCAHRSLRHFAETAAALGVPALRFDYDGTGDSAGDDRDAARWVSWLSSVHAAVEEMRRSAGVERVCLLGVRIGATLAAVAASERHDVAGLVAIAPVVTGKAWLREINALQIALGHAPPPPGRAPAEGIEESVGFVLTAETRASLASIDLLGVPRPPAQEILLLDRDDLAPNARLVERLRTLGAQVEHCRVPGYVEMMLDPHDAVVPERMLATTAAWLNDRILAGHPYSARPPVPPPASAAPVAAGVVETAGFLDAAGTLFGVTSTPAGGARPTRAIVLLNAGAIHHVGPSRMYVQLARRWAAKGHLVLRFDLAGIGDSPPRPGAPENVVYSPWAERDVAAALTYLRERWGAVESAAVGLCSGAYHALKVAAAALPVDQAVLINPLVFFWKPGMSLAYPAHEVVDAAAQYRRSALQLEKWKKFFSGKVNVREFAAVTARRTASLAARRIRDIARRVGRPLADDLGAELESIAQRKVAVRFVFATGDPGEPLLELQAGSSLARLLRNGRLRIQRVDGPDHSFTPVWSHEVLAAILDMELDLR
jgi:pimeloyl-ACP methyl ester carboxylesterase